MDFDNRATMNEPAPGRTTNAVLEVALLVLAAHVFVTLVFAATPFPVVGGLLPDSLVPDLGVAFALLVVRTLRNRPGVAPLPRPGLRPGQWLSRLRGPGLVLAASFLLAIFLQHRHRPALGIDGPLFFVQVRSAVIDHDLDLTNEFRDFVPEKFQHWAEEARQLGKSPDPNVEPGPAILWSPFFLAAHGLVLVARALGSTLPADGYQAPYISAVCVASLFWALVGVALAYRVARTFFPPMLAAVSVAGAFFASPLLWYSVYEPAMPHAPATAAVGVFLLLWLRLDRRPEQVRRWLELAFAGGILVSMNRYNAYFAMLPALTALRMLVAPRALRWANLRPVLLTALGLVAAFMLAASPWIMLNLRGREGQLFREQSLFGFTLRNVAAPQVGELLFSSLHGLVSWTPMAAVGFLGLGLLLRRERRLAVAFLLTLAFGILLLAASYDWTGGWSFGSRRLTEAFALFAVGVCAVAELLMRAPQVLGIGALALLSALNLLLAGQVERGEVPRQGTFAFKDVAERAVSRVYDRVGHPGAWPASWLFAWRYSVSPARFDTLYGHLPVRELTLAMGTTEADGYLGQGWCNADKDSDPPFRWSNGPVSTVLVPLAEAVDYDVRLRGAASRNPAGLDQTITLRVNEEAVAVFTLGRDWAERNVSVPARHWRAGLNEVAFVYAWSVEARDVYRTRETRRLAWRAEEVAIRPAQKQ